jgi:hypothetical protein
MRNIYQGRGKKSPLWILRIEKGDLGGAIYLKKPNYALRKISDFSPLFPSPTERRTNTRV